MPRRNVALVAGLSVVLLASCGSQEPTTDQNRAPDSEANRLEGARPTSDPGQPGIDKVVDPAPPPDAVSHPDGYLPNASDAPSEPEPEPAAVNQPRSEKPPPATEDEYIHRNKQAAHKG